LKQGAIPKCCEPTLSDGTAMAKQSRRLAPAGSVVMGPKSITVEAVAACFRDGNIRPIHRVVHCGRVTAGAARRGHRITHVQLMTHVARGIADAVAHDANVMAR